MTNIKKNDFWYWGFAISLCQIVSVMLFHTFDMFFNKANNYLLYLIGFIGAMIFFYQVKKHISSSFIYYLKTGLRLGIKASLIISAMYLLILLLFPSIKEESLAIANNQLLEKGMSTTERDSFLRIVERTFVLFAIIGVFIFNLLINLLAATIAYFFVKKKRSAVQ